MDKGIGLHGVLLRDWGREESLGTRAGIRYPQQEAAVRFSQRWRKPSWGLRGGGARAPFVMHGRCRIWTARGLADVEVG
ncbi:hypothetical protein D3C87_1418370 [compost metagenome]